MRKKISIAVATILAAVFLLFAPANAGFVSANAQEVSYEVKEAGSNNTSVADGYFIKPAKFTVENGKNFLEFSLKDADYVKSLSGPYGAVRVISDSGNKRVVKLQVDDISNPIDLKMHIVVPEEVAGMPYDHDHKARMIVNTDGVDLSAFAAAEESDDKKSNDEKSNDEKSDDKKAEGEKDKDNPKTSDTTPLVMYTVLMVGSVGVMVFLWRRRTASE